MVPRLKRRPWMLILSVTLIIISGVCAYQITRDLLYPPVLLAIVWASTLLLALANREHFAPLGPEIPLLAAAGVCAFGLGGAFGLESSSGLFLGFSRNRKYCRLILRPMLACTSAIGIAALILPIAIYRVNELAASGPLPGACFVLRIPAGS